MALQDRGVRRRVDVEQRRGRALQLTRREAALLVQPARKRIVRRGKVDDGECRRRREGDEVRGVVVVRQHERLARVDLFAQPRELGDAHERARAGADRRHTLETARARQREQLLAEMERRRVRRHHVRATAREGRARFGISGDRNEWRESRLARPREHDRADRDLDRIEPPLDLGRTAAAEEDGERRRHSRERLTCTGTRV